MHPTENECILSLFKLFNMQMRLNKVSELIHNSTNHQNLDSAGVSVHFQEIIDLVCTSVFVLCQSLKVASQVPQY